MNNKREYIVESEILTLVKRYCGTKLVGRFIKEQKKAAHIESAVSKQSAKREHFPAVATQPKIEGPFFDHVVTMCKHHLPEAEFQEVVLDMGNVFKSHGLYTKAEEMYSTVANLGKEHYVAEALLRRGEVYSRLGRWKQSTQDLNRSRTLFQKERDAVDVGKAENVLATNYAEQGEMEEAQEWFTRALSRFERSKKKTMAGMVLINLGVIQNILGNLDGALNYYRRALPTFHSTGDMTRLAEIRHNMGMSQLSKQNYKAAIREFDASLSYSMKLQNPELVGISFLGKAVANFYLKDHAIALVYCNQAIEELEASNSRLGLADVYKVKGMILREKEEYNAATTFFQSSIRINEEYGNSLNLGETYYEIGVMERQRKHSSEARAALRQALKFFGQVGARSEVEKTRQALKLCER